MSQDLDQEGFITEEFQKILLASATSSVSSSSLIDKDRKEKLLLSKTKNSGNISNDDIEKVTGDSLDPQYFDKWIPFLRSTIEKDQLAVAVDELRSSTEDNFQGLEVQLLRDFQVTNKLTNSISEVSDIQSAIEQQLTRQMMDFQTNLSNSTNELIVKKKIFLNNKKTSLKISESIILITKVLRILELSSKCQELISEKSFFKALQNLDNLEKLYLQEFKNYNFGFLKEIYDSIPFLKKVIRDECINLIRNSFNLNLGKNLEEVGHTMFACYNDELLAQWLQKRDQMDFSSFKFNSPVEISLRDQEVLSSISLDKFFHLDEFHDAIMIFETLQESQYLLSEFTNEYEFRKNKVIFPLVWKKTVNNINITTADIERDAFTKSLNLEFLQTYLLRILGFLMYDICLNKATDFSLVDNNYNSTNEFWEGLLNRLGPYLSYFMQKYLNDEEEIVKFKDFLSVYVAIIENFNLTITPLYNILLSVFQKYCDISMSSFSHEFKTLLDDDDFMPLTIQDKSLLDKVLKICWLKKDEDSKLMEEVKSMEDSGSQFSITLPFSPLYPMTCTLAKKIYSKLTNFISVFYGHNLQYLSNILIKTMDVIFNDIVNQQIKSKLDSNSREEIAQILINLDYFIIASKEFSKMMTNTNILQNPDIEIKLSSIKHYVESRKYAESKLINLIDSKISDIFDTVEFDWSANRIRKEPDISIIDVAQFLEMMFASTLVNLPYSIQTLLIFREFDSLTRKVLDLLLHETPNRLTPESVLNFEIDVNYLQGIIPRIFPSIEPSPSESRSSTPATSSRGASDHPTSLIENNIKSLEETFTELNQCIELLKSRDYAEYADPEIRMRKFSRIKAEDAQWLISKVKSLTPEPDDGSDNKSVMGSVRSSTPSNDSSANTNRLAKLFGR